MKTNERERKREHLGRVLPQLIEEDVVLEDALERHRQQVLERERSVALEAARRRRGLLASLANQQQQEQTAQLEISTKSYEIQVKTLLLI